MPGEMASMAAVYGGSFALIGICRIIINLNFLYRLTLQAGLFRILPESIGGITNDRRLQPLLIAVCFGALFGGRGRRGHLGGGHRSIPDRAGFHAAGSLYPFSGTLIGWLGVALTGTDAGSNALFGSQQQITANQLGLSPTLMAAANSSGGVLGKMIDARSIVVASTATNYVGKEGLVLRYVFWRSIALACLVGGLVMLQA